MSSQSYPFPVASHTYFRALNKNEARDEFLRSSTINPVFVYRQSLQPATITSRLRLVDPHSYAYTSLQLVLLSGQLQQDAGYLAQFQAQNKLMYGPTNPEYCHAILDQLASIAVPAKADLLQEMFDLIKGYVPGPVFLKPSERTFATYRAYFTAYRHDHNEADSVVRLVQHHLHKTGLDKEGWTLQVRNDSSHAHVNNAKKIINIGALYQPRSYGAAARIAVHEVYGHALRGPQASVAESEGFALVLEQLLAERFAYARSYRYLAASLGAGVFGVEMNFRQVYDILWRAMAVGSGYSEQRAKLHAFDECYRVFRGGRPDIPGAVYLKDSVYFSANVAMWKILEAHYLSYNEFIDVIEGRRSLLK